MSETSSSQVAQVLFLDIVGYSQGTTAAQSRQVALLTEVVNESGTYKGALAENSVLALPTGDGMALIFWGDVNRAANAAKEVGRSLNRQKELRVRAGLHSGLIQRQTDIKGSDNVVGEGINTAQRVMDVGDAGHILISQQYASLLRQFEEWKPMIKDLGEATVKHGQIVQVCNLCGSDFGNQNRPGKLSHSPKGADSKADQKVAILYKRNSKKDTQLVELIEKHLVSKGFDVFIDRHLKIGVEWATAIESKIRSSDAVIALLSDSAVGSEMLEYELEAAADERQKREKPILLPVRIGSSEPLAGAIGNLVNAINFTIWNGPEDDEKLLDDLDNSLAQTADAQVEVHLEPTGGAVPINSNFYVERPTDHECLQALEDNESIVLVKGPRQMGKTSLIARGVALARERGWRIVNVDFQKLSAAQLANDNIFYRLIAATLGRQIGFKYDFAQEWVEEFGANLNLDFFMRALLESSDVPLVWFMDEADRIFGVPFASDFFGLVRSWHNSRAMEPDGPWSRMTIVIGYATEAHLFIQDLNQSPFNVGRQLQLQPFTIAQVTELNTRHGSIVKSDQMEELYNLTGGQPFLTRRAFEVLSQGRMDFKTLLETADTDEGAFGDHLKRILMSVSAMPSVLGALRQSLANPGLKDTDGFYRLLAAGVVTQTPDKQVAFRNDLYKRYLSSHLGNS